MATNDAQTGKDEMKARFLKEDFKDSLKWLFVGAVTWQAHSLEQDHHYMRALGMFTCLVQARALYEFFFGSPTETIEKGSTACARHYVRAWGAKATCIGNTWQEKPRLRNGFFILFMSAASFRAEVHQARS